MSDSHTVGLCLTVCVVLLSGAARREQEPDAATLGRRVHSGTCTTLCCILEVVLTVSAAGQALDAVEAGGNANGIGGGGRSGGQRRAGGAGAGAPAAAASGPRAAADARLEQRIAGGTIGFG